ncbi:MAG: hypothetical protein GY804_11640 [Alphaproteobacteria bacterium]|nr:hypothetical protein [Alphaproteobacteria bacterium]
MEKKAHFAVSGLAFRAKLNGKGDEYAHKAIVVYNATSRWDAEGRALEAFRDDHPSLAGWYNYSVTSNRVKA